nr:homoserine kinase [Polymorphobacter sp.]
MAVFTPVSAEALAGFLDRYDVGTATSFKGIAEGVQNSNFLLDTDRGTRYFLTLYEDRIDAADLPYFLALTTHLADKGLPVPRPIPDRGERILQMLCGRPACLIEYVPGVSVTMPSPVDAFATAAAMGAMHRALTDFTLVRDNEHGPAGWRRLTAAIGDRFGTVSPGLSAIVDEELGALAARWPTSLDRSTIHADLFADNVLLLGGKVSGLIDFYFACTDIRAYDLAVMHAAWCFSADGRRYNPAIASALFAGYRSEHPLTDAEVAAFAILCRGASLRFTLSRAYDWITTPADALVTKKDPMAFARRLIWYRGASHAELFGA